MNWMDNRKSPCTCFAGIAFVIMVLFLMSSCGGPTPTNTLVPTNTPVSAAAIVSTTTDILTPISTPTATDTLTQSYPAPTLVNPVYGATIMGGEFTNFYWHWDGTLQEVEKFDLRIWRVEKPCCTIDMLCECSYLLDAPPDGFGHYLWQVAIIRDDESGSKSTLCESLIWPFVWSDMPPTSTPTAMPTPTPKPDAVVNTANLNLRSGPSTDYEILGVLKQGDPLKIKGKDSPEDWLKVIAPDGEEGWVAAWLLEINLDISGVLIAQAPPTPTPMYTPTPTLTPTPELYPAPTSLEPKDGEGDFTGSVDLKWQWVRDLKEGEIYSLRVWRKGEPQVLCHHVQAKIPEYSGDLTSCRTGTVCWWVAVVRKVSEGPPPEWEDVSENSEAPCFSYHAVEPEPSGPGEDEQGGGEAPEPPW